MDGLNEAALEHILRSNTPNDLGRDLASWTSFVAEVEGSGVVGVGALDDAEIKRVYVDPERHGRRIGSALLDALEATAAKAGIDVVSLEASPSSEAFYLELGYAFRGSGAFSIGDAEFRFVKMSKTLAVPGDS